MNLRDEVSDLIKERISNSLVFGLNDKSRLWWYVTGEVLELVAKRLEITFEDGYVEHRGEK